MTNLAGSAASRILLDKIDLQNRDYKLSRNIIDDKLERSVKACGIIEPPLLLQEKNGYIIIYGHNRIKTAARLGIQAIDSIVIQKLNYQTLIDNALLKYYRGEIGPVGRSKLIIIILKEFNPETKTLIELSKDLDLPAEFINDPVLPGRIIDLPDGLKDYLDYKDINIKTIKYILTLPDEIKVKLNEWVSHAAPRANIFKNIIDCLIDIVKKNRSLKMIHDIDLASIEDRRAREVYLHDRIFKLRYPEYSGLKEKADGMIKNFNSMGFKVDFPEYFEGEDICLRLSINKRDRLNQVEERIKNINMDDIKKLLELL